MSNKPTRLDVYASLLHELKVLRQELLQAEQDFTPLLEKIAACHSSSAVNLIHYLALRRHDMRPLQFKLAAIGLSSLGRAESHVLSTLDAVSMLLCDALGAAASEALPEFETVPLNGAAILVENTSQLLGQPPVNRWVRIMATLSTEAAGNYQLVKEMLRKGVDCVRINCAHDGPDIWSRMVHSIRLASQEMGRECRILMDLAGPKLRTGPVEPGPELIKWQPHRNALGQIVALARIWLYPGNTDAPSPPCLADACLPLEADWLQLLAIDDTALEFKDARGKMRRLVLKRRVGGGVWAECSKTAYVQPGILLYPISLSTKEPLAGVLPGVVGRLPQKSEIIRLKRGDQLALKRQPSSGHAARYEVTGSLLQPATIACSLPEVFECAQVGERIAIDDGRMGGIIKSVSPDQIMVEIVQAQDRGEKLAADQGINLPDTRFNTTGLTSDDIESLNFVVHHADIVGLSFVRGPSDVELLQHHLERLDAASVGIVVKIETRQAFERLPEILFALLRWPVVGLMIARGDLAIECGYERLAELQEEILWLAEAAHIPVIWATQVLENMTRTGKPTRAEITDAAMGERAECVMLNKGEHIIKAIEMLDNILQHMQAHQHKKSALLHRLRW